MAKKNEELEYTSHEAAPADAAPTEAAVKPAKKYNFNNLNTLAVVSIATALSGFGAVAGVITGHVALAQLKKDGKQGRGLAIAGLAVGYAAIGFAIVGAIVKGAIGIWGTRYGIDFDGQQGFGNMGGDFEQHGPMGQFDGGQMGGHMGGQQGFDGPMMGDQNGQLVDPQATTAPETQTN